MGASLDVTFKHDALTGKPRYVTNTDIQAVASSVRAQAGLGDKRCITVDDLLAIRGVRANGTAYAIEWSVEAAVTNEEGLPVLGLCEYDPDGLPNTALIFANPEAVAAYDGLLISTLAHEFGHGVFDVPGWIIASETRALPGLCVAPMRQRYRCETPDAQHLSPVREPERRVRDFTEWRANEFMGSFLVPKALLTRALDDCAAALKLPVEVQTSTSSLVPLSASPDIRIAGTLTAADLSVKVPALIRALADEFGVSRRFIEVRLLRYGCLDPAQLAPA